MMIAAYTITRGVRRGFLVSVLLLMCGVVTAFAQDFRTRDLLLDDDASTGTTRNTITLRSPTDANLLNDYVLRLPNVNGLAAGSLLYVESYASSTAVTRWLVPTANSVLTSDATGIPVWQDISVLMNISQEWIDGDSIGVPGVIYAAQALQSGTADTVVVTDAGHVGVGTATPGGLITVRGSGNLFRGEESDGTLRSVLHDDGEHDWYLGGMTGEVGQAQVGTTSGFPSFSLYRPGNTDRFDILNHSTYTALGYNADGAVGGNVLTIEQGGNVGVGLADPTAKLHVSATSDPLRLEGLVENDGLDSIMGITGQGVVQWMSMDSLISRVLDSATSVDAWLVDGNSGTNPSLNYVGTSDAQNLSIRANAVQHLLLNATDGSTSASNIATANGSRTTLINTLDFRSNNAQATGGNIVANTLLLGTAGSTGSVNGQSNAVDVQVAGTFNELRGQYNQLLLGAANPSVTRYYGALNDLTSGTASASIAEYHGFRSTMTGNPLITDAWGVSVGAPGSNTTNFTGLQVDNIPAAAGTRRAFFYKGTGANEPVVVTNAGQVGIGVTAPTAGRLLEVDGTAGTANVRMTSLSGASLLTTLSGNEGIVVADNNGDLTKRSPQSVMGQYGWLVAGNAGTNPATNFLGTTDAQGLALRTNNSEAVRIGTNQFVGIGTTNPLRKLHIGGGDIRMSNQASHLIEMHSTGGANRPIGDVRFYENDTTWFGSFSFSGEPNMFYFTAGSGAGDIDTLMAIDGQGSNKGYVGIGLAPATDAALRQKLQVHDGNILLSNTGTAGELRFEEPSPGGQNYSAFRARSQAADITYLLPDTIGIAGDVLRIMSVAGTTATLDWIAGSSGGGSGSAWLLTGNSSTNPSNNFLGTTDNVALEIRVNNARAFRFDPRTASPNITGGHSSNSISTNQDGNVIAGGGASGASNQIGSGVNYGFIGGGSNNQIHSNSVYGVVTGGYNNRLTSTADRSTIVGGEGHQIDNTQFSFVGGGYNNRMSSDADYSTIVGGNNHQIDNGQYSFIGGGYNNRMSSDADYSSIAGGNNGQIDNGKYAFIGGGDNNRMNSDADYSAIGAGNNNQISNGEYALIGSGLNNQINSNADYSAVVAGSGNQVSGGQYSTIGGGSSNIIGSTSHYSFIGSGTSNQVTSGADRSTVIGGGSNQIDNSQYALIGGGSGNRLTSDADYSIIVGGQSNQIDNGQNSLIVSGNNNRLTSDPDFSVIVGGSNIQVDNSDYAFIGSGASIQMTSNTNYSVVTGGQSISLNNSSYGVVGGGQSNTINNATHVSLGGGQSNTASGAYGVISGGQSNTLSGSYSTIAGGRGLTLSGSRSFGFLGGNTGSNNMSISSSDIAVFGNTDVWLANNDNGASQLRFYEPNTSTGSFPGSANYTSLRAQAQNQDIEYIFPDTAGSVGDVLVVRSKTGTQVTLDWATTNETSTIGKLLFARKTADETVSGTTLQNDDHLSIALEAGKAYEISGALYCRQISGNADLNLAWTVPGGTGGGAGNSTMLISFYAYERKNGGNRDVGGDTRTASGTGAPDTAGEIDLGGNLVIVHFTGMVITGTSSGNIVLQWAPTAGGGDQVRLLANSFMSATVAQ